MAAIFCDSKKEEEEENKREEEQNGNTRLQKHLSSELENFRDSSRRANRDLYICIHSFFLSLSLSFFFITTKKNSKTKLFMRSLFVVEKPAVPRRHHHRNHGYAEKGTHGEDSGKQLETERTHTHTH